MEEQVWNWHRDSLRAYLTEDRFSLNWILGIPEDCSFAEFEQHVGDLKAMYSKFAKWADIPAIRIRLNTFRILKK